MKTKLATLLLTAILAIAIAAPVAAPAAATAPAPDITLATATPAPLLLAQADAPAPAATPWYLNGVTWLALISAALGAVAAWQNKDKTRAEKINATLILGIEAASKIPEVERYEKMIKGRIKQEAARAGVQPALDKLVQILT